MAHSNPSPVALKASPVGHTSCVNPSETRCAPVRDASSSLTVEKSGLFFLRQNFPPMGDHGNHHGSIYINIVNSNEHPLLGWPSICQALGWALWKKTNLHSKLSPDILCHAFSTWGWEFSSQGLPVSSQDRSCSKNVSISPTPTPQLCNTPVDRECIGRKTGEFRCLIWKTNAVAERLKWSSQTALLQGPLSYSPQELPEGCQNS